MHIPTVSQTVLRLQQILANHTQRSGGPRGLFIKKRDEGTPYQSSCSLRLNVISAANTERLMRLRWPSSSWQTQKLQKQFPTSLIGLFKMTPCSSHYTLRSACSHFRMWPWFKYPGHTNRLPKIPPICVSSLPGSQSALQVNQGLADTAVMLVLITKADISFPLTLAGLDSPCWLSLQVSATWNFHPSKHICHGFISVAQPCSKGSLQF